VFEIRKLPECCLRIYSTTRGFLTPLTPIAGQPAINNAGEVVYSGFDSGGRQQIFSTVRGQLTSFGGAPSFLTADFPDIDNNGRVIFRGSVSDAPDTNALYLIDGAAHPPDPSINDTCDVGSGPNDIETVTASYDDGNDEIVVEMVLCADADNKTSYRVFFDHQGGIDDGPDTLDPNPHCMRTWDDRMQHKGRHDRGPGMIDVFGSTLIFRVGVPELNPFLMPFDTVKIWTDTKLKNVTDKAPNTESGDGCAKPEVASEVISLELN